MHDFLAHGYHLGLRAVAFALKPQWRAPAAAILTALILPLFFRVQARSIAGLAVLAGWFAVPYPGLSVLPAYPVDRLPGLGAILLVHNWLAPRAGAPRPWLGVLLLAIVSSWWIAGAPLGGWGLAAWVPVFLGVGAVLALTMRATAKTGVTAAILAAASLGGAIFLAGGASHWARAALVPACGGIALLRVPEAALPLALATMLEACLAVFASDRSRFVPVDLAALAPLTVWALWSRRKSS